MMESCLLCLKTNEYISDYIKINSLKWQQHNITNVINNHFWPLNIQPRSWICSPCWQEVDSFHRFYLRIEKSHMKFGNIKAEKWSPKYKEEPEMQITDVSYNFGELDEDSVVCPIEPETKSRTCQNDVGTEKCIYNPKSHELQVESDIAITELINESDFDNMPLKLWYKYKKIQSNEDSLKKSRKKTVAIEEENNCEYYTIKEEPIDINDTNSHITTDNDNNGSDFNYHSVKDFQQTTKYKSSKTYSRYCTSQKESEEFISKHLKQILCDLCKAPIEAYSAVSKHFSKIHNRRGYVVCCKKKFFDRNRLVDHIHCHLNPDYFKCNECGKVMSERVTYENHILRVHRANEVVKRHHCDICGKSFIKPYVLKYHKLTHLNEEEKKFACNDCGKKYASPDSLKQHKERVHLKRFYEICYICGKSVKPGSEFKAHLNKHEGIVRSVVCDICGFRLTSKRGLMLHKESQHPVGGKQDRHCPFCSKISPTLIALKKHINSMHKKYYKCSNCEKTFKRPENLRKHMTTHSEAILYNCSWCPKSFNSKVNRRSHHRNKHPKEWKQSKL